MANYILSDLIAKAQNNSIAAVSVSNSKLSVSIVNNINGKRFSISKALSETLNLEDTAYFLPVQETGQLLISAAPLGQYASKVTLSGTGKKICYNAALVQNLSACFKLDFSAKTSMSFTDIDIDTSTGQPVAVVSIAAPVAAEVSDAG